VTLQKISHRLGIEDALGRAIAFAGGFTRLSWKAIEELFTQTFPTRLVLEQLHSIGVQSFVLVLITGMATGSVMALQFGQGLARFGGTLYVPKLTALAILREMGPVFTSLLVAGRIGSGMASEIASMKVTQQIDAIRALGTSPIQKIVIPRLLACLVALPILTLMGDFVGLIGAMLIAKFELNIDIEFFVTKALETVTFTDLSTGLAKTAVFAFFIAISSCWKGLHTEGGTEGVGRTTTWVVVTSSIFIMIADFFLTKLFFMTVYPKY
jgi:phospholipid/cholesterol/gamma-HCH transport system permease protein